MAKKKVALSEVVKVNWKLLLHIVIGLVVGFIVVGILVL